MKQTNEITQLLKVISSLHNQQVQKHLVVGNSITLFSGSKALAEIDSKQVSLCGYNLLDKLIAKKDDLNRQVTVTAFSNLLDDISGSILRLNHIGISYAVEDSESEIIFYKRIAKEAGFDFFLEPSEDPLAKWLFVGDTHNWESPLFEIVLTKTSITETMWRPHFQIDIDTSLSQRELEDKLKKYLGNSFVQWKLDIPHYGVVLEMGMLGSVHGTKIYLGISTNLRNTKYHREHILQNISSP